jgi:hypothetical protein
VNLQNFLFGIIHRYSTPSSICRAVSQGLLKVINVSCIMIALNRLQIMYTNKTVRLYYRLQMKRSSGRSHQDQTTSPTIPRPQLIIARGARPAFASQSPLPWALLSRFSRNNRVRTKLSVINKRSL